MVRSRAKDSSTTVSKDRRQLTKARVIYQNETIALTDREAREARDVRGRKARQPQKPQLGGGAVKNLYVYHGSNCEFDKPRRQLL